MTAAYRRILTLLLALCILAGPAGLSLTFLAIDTEQPPAAAGGEDSQYGESSGEQADNLEAESAVADADENPEDTPADDAEQAHGGEQSREAPDASGTDSPAHLATSLGQSEACDSAQRLFELLNAGETEITLTGDIVITEDSTVNTSDVPATVYMGEYGITAEARWVRFLRPIHFVGEGVRTPLFTVRSNTRFVTSDGFAVQATGDGAVAIYNDGGVFTQPRTVIANGANAIAYHDVPGSMGGALADSQLSANGEGGTALRVEGDMQLDRCVLTAEGAALDVEGLLLANYSDITGDILAGGEIVLDLCYVDPVPAAATIVPRRATWHTGPPVSLTDYGFVLAQDEVLDLPQSLYPHFWRSDSDYEIDFTNVPVSWGEIYPDKTDPNLSWVEATPDIPRYMEGVENLLPVKVPIRRYDTREPYLASANAVKHYIPLGSVIHITPAMVYGDAEEIILWVSADYGASWTPYSSKGEYENIYYYEQSTNFILHEYPDEHAYLFQYEVKGGSVTGKSNILRFWHTKRATVDPQLGDLEGDGRGEGELPGGGEPPTEPLTVVPPDEGAAGGVQPTTEPSGAGGDGNADATGGGVELPGYAGGGGGISRTAAAVAADSGGLGAAGSPDDPLPPDAGNPPQTPVGQPEGGGPSTGEEALSPAAAAAPAPVYPEGVMVYSSAELSVLAVANPERITFLQGSLRAVLPTADLLEAVEGDSFAILLEESGRLRFHIGFYAGGRELTDLGGADFQVSLPAPDQMGVPACTGEDAVEIPARLEDGRITCTLTRTGRYEITAGPVVEMAAADTPAAEPDFLQIEGNTGPEDPPSGSQAALWVTLPCIAAGAAGFTLLRRRGRRG